MSGIGSFTRHAKQSGFGGQWLKDWKDDKKVVIWLHTRVPPAACWSHPFMLLDVVEDKENGGSPKRIMRYPRFVSPDPELVHRNQYFRKDDDVLRVPPDRDPFLLLREWLRRADSIGLEQPVFQWKNPKDNEVTTWVRGELSGLVKRARSNFGHTLDTKQEYIFVVVLNDGPDQGIFLARESQLLGRKVSEVITQQQSMLGDAAGDPLLNPYPFVWEANKKAPSPMDMYKAYKADGIECSDEVWAAITAEEHPDPVEFCTPRDGDMEKVRAAMEAAAQVDLPLDEIFSDDPAARLALVMGQRRAARGPAQRAQQPAAGAQGGTQTRQAGTQPGAQQPGAQQSGAQQSGAQRPGTQRPAASGTQASRPGGAPQRTAAPSAAKTSAAPAKPAAGQPRRKKVEKPKPEIEKIPCDDCQHPMLPTDTVCAKCGAVYETGGAEESVAEAGTEEQQPASAQEGCFSCGGEVVNEKCTGCGIDQGDNIPF